MESTRLDIIFQIFSNMRDISLYKKYRYFFDIFSKVDNNYFETVKKNFFISRLPRIFLELVFIIIITSLIFYIIKFDKDALKQIPSIAFIVAVAVRLIPLFTKIIFAIQSLKFFEKSFKLIDKELKIQKKFKKFDIKNNKINFSNEIELNGVSFNYEKKTILRDINFKIVKNNIVGIIGRSGSGKSTLLKLISGLLEPSEGKIFIDKIEIQKKI